jgi:ferric-dicitrate binding protein FerR (iron transport regulator)
MNTIRQEYLFRRSITGTATPEEQQEWTDWLTMPENEAMARAWMERAYDEPKDLVQLEPDKAISMIASILDAGREENSLYDGMRDRVQVVPSARRRRLAYWTTSIAASCLLAYAGFYLVGRHVGNKGIASQTPIVPGSNRAVLTLANGQTIVLDSAQDGQLPTQGGVKLVKLNGSISYMQAGREAGSTEVVYNTLRTPRGGQYQIQLPDGSKVWLNSASVLRFPTAFNGKDRRLELEGEAYIEVARNAQMPFVLQAGKVSVDVLGTSFNVMAYADEAAIKTTLVSGSVKVNREGRGGTVILPGQYAAYDQTGGLKIEQADLKQVLAWKDGEFRFAETRLTDIMRQIARWYDVDVEYKGDFTNVVLSGVISRRQYVSQLLEVLEISGDVHFVIKDRTITVTNK